MSVKVYGFIIVIDCKLIKSKLEINAPSVVVRIYEILFQTNGFIIIIDGSLILPQLIVNISFVIII